jgi:hypothetical protein
MSERAKRVVAVAAILAAALLVFGPALAKREVFMFRDHSDYFQPLRLFTAQHLRVWRLPLWNPYNGSGEPWLANPQTAIFYPPAWLFVILPFATAYVAYLFVHSLLLGGGAFLLFRRSASQLAATAGAIALMLSGPVLSMLDVQNNFTTFAWLPLLMWCGAADLGGEERGNAAGGGGATLGVTGVTSGVVLAMTFLAGEPFLAAIAALIYIVIVRRVKTIVIAGVTAASLAAIQLLPFIEMLIKSDRLGGFSEQDVLRSSMSIRDWMLMIVSPRLLQTPLAAREQFIFIVYVSTFVVLLAIAGGVILAIERRGLGWMAMLAIAAVIASGPRWIARLPIELFRYPARLMPYVAFALVALAVAAWDRIARRSAVVGIVLTLAVAVDLFVVARPILVTAPFTRSRVPYPQSIGRSSKILQAYGENPLAAGTRASWIAGYTNLFDLRFAATTAAPMSPRSYDSLLGQATSRLDLLREIGTGFVLASSPLSPAFEPVARSERVVVYRVPHPLPMAYVVTPRGTRELPRALALDASSARVIVDTASGGTLILTQNDAPGWGVTIDGRDAMKKLALGTFRAVDVTGGKHEIVWRYRPLSLVIGVLITLFAIVALMLSRAIVKRRAHEKFSFVSH